MLKALITILIYSSIFAAEITLNDNTAMVSEIGNILSGAKNFGDSHQCSTFKTTEAKCSPVISDYMRKRSETNWQTNFLLKDSPYDLCSGVKFNDNYYTSVDKLDNYLQGHVGGVVPSFTSVNNQCFNQYSSMNEKNDAVSYYYYAQMRLLEDGITTINSAAALDSKLGRPVLSGIKCEKLGRLAEYCKQLKGCQQNEEALEVDTKDTVVALNLLSEINEVDPKNEADEEKLEAIKNGIKQMYPWIEGKNFKKSLGRKDINSENIKIAIEEQIRGTYTQIQERTDKYNQLSSCIENESVDCEDFHKKLNELLPARAIDFPITRPGLLAKMRYDQQGCINEQRNIRNEMRGLTNDFLIGSVLTIGTMGLGTIATGSGHIIKSAHTAGTLSKADKVRKSMAAFSVKNSKAIKNSAKGIIAGMGIYFTAVGVKDTTNICKKELNNLEAYGDITDKIREKSVCPINQRDSQFQLLSDYKNCVIAALFSSVDFLPLVPAGVAKIKAQKIDQSKLESEVLNEIDPDNLKEKPMKPGYEGEDKGMSKNLVSFVNKHGKPNTTKYFYGKTKEKFRGYIRDGKIYDSLGRPITNKIVDVGNGETEALEIIFVFDKSGKLYLHSNPEPGRLHHSSLVAGDNVLSAGALKIENGVVREIRDQSGHYAPGKVDYYQGVYLMLKEGLDLSNAELVRNFK